MGSIISRRLLFAALMAGLLVPDGIAQSPEGLENVFISLQGAPAMGDEKAGVAIVEFADYECPFCSKHANGTLEQIVSDYVKTGKVLYFFKDLPIEPIHPQAFKEAEAAHCAGEQGKYWEMHDRLLKNQRPEVINELSAFALALGLDVSRFQRCLDHGTYAAQIRKDIEQSKEYKIKGTPTFFVGTLNSEGSQMKAVTMIYGAQPYPTFQKALDQLLTPAEEH